MMSCWNDHTSQLHNGLELLFFSMWKLDLTNKISHDYILLEGSTNSIITTFIKSFLINFTILLIHCLHLYVKINFTEIFY